MSIRVLLVDDHELIRHGLAISFSRDPDMEVVGQAGSVAAALAAWRTLTPDVVVTDLQMGDGSGLDLIREIRSSDERVGLVMLTMHSADEQIFAAMGAGASAFVTKDSRAQHVVQAARHAAQSPRSFLCAELAGAMLRRTSKPKGPRLSARESEVLTLLSEGLSTSGIARRLYMSDSTAKTHLSRIYQKLDATNRAQALVAAMKLGLIATVSTDRSVPA